jgi:uncharacterized caspase-like protein
MKTNIILTVLSFAFFIFISVVLAEDMEEEIRAYGRADITAENVAGARDKAIEDALRKALEVSVESLLSLESMIDNYQTIQDAILSKSSGYITSYKILHEEQKSWMYNVTITAKVGKSHLKKDLDALRRVKVLKENPRIMIIINETLEGGQKAPQTETALIEKFLKNGFKVVDQRTIEQSIDRDRLIKAIEMDDKTVASMGLNWGADMVIIGTTVSNTRSIKVSGVNIESTNLATTARVIRVGTGEVLIGKTETARAPQATYLGRQMAIEKICENLSSYFIPKILNTWNSQKTVVHRALADPIMLPKGMTQKANAKDWALIIGIEDYANLPSVEYARKDAFVMREYLIKVLGVPEENVISLIDGSATKARMEGYIKQYIPSNVDKDTTLYVYIAGHGIPGIEKGYPYLVPYDGDTRFIEQTGYNLKSLYQDLDNLDIKRAYVFLDSCFSGVAARTSEMLIKGARPALLHVKNLRLDSADVVFFSAATGGQISNIYPEKKHGLFTYFLLRALKGEADIDEDGWINVQEIFEYVKDNVTRVSRRMSREQTPAIMPYLDELKNLAVSRVPSPGKKSKGGFKL